MEYYSSFISLAIFCLILFVYLHIFFHIKTSNDLELYEITPPSKDKLHEICDLKQPAMFKFYNKNIYDVFNLERLKKEYGSFDVNLREINDNEGRLYFKLPYKVALELFETEKEKKYYLENNYDFFNETQLLNNFKSIDELLRPQMVCDCNYDLMIGTKDATTPLRYTLENRHYLYCCESSATVRLIPPNYSKYLYMENDYVNFEFRSKINPWNVEKEYRIDFDKCKYFDVDVTMGQIIYIPSYWLYSVKLSSNSNILVFSYRTYMSSISILPQLSMSLLQKYNVKENSTETLNHSIPENVDEISLDEKIDLSGNSNIEETNDTDLSKID
tara:strand:+ start:1119 stop:2108 length:990 start_codon:yes stop_codon:yes gene_type:complete